MVRPLVTGILLAVLAGPASGAVQTEAQQRCLNGLHAAGARVAEAFARHVVRCVKDAARGDEAATRCIAGQRSRALEKAKRRTARIAARRCKETPEFGPTDAATVNTAFGAMLHSEALFGRDLDAAIIQARRDRAGAACQAAVLDGLARLTAAKLAAVGRCQAAGLAAGTIGAAGDLGSCRDDDARGIVERARTRIARRVSRRCARTPISTAFPGECAEAGLGGLVDCLERRADCDVCLAGNAAGQLSALCHRFASGVARPYCGNRPATTQSIARQWNEQLLEAIRRDTPRPTVHARNLFHVSVAMYDAWTAYDDGPAVAYLAAEHPSSTAPSADRETAISFAAYRIIAARFTGSPGKNVTLPALDAKMLELGLDPSFTATEGDAAAAVGNRIAAAVLAYGLMDGANEAAGYGDTTGYVPANEPLVVKATDPPVLADPGRWQPLALDVFITQNGIALPDKVQTIIGPHWNNVRPFALTRADPADVYLDPGPPPIPGGATDAAFKAAHTSIVRLSGRLDTGDGQTLDISPGARGNNPLGTNDGVGYAANPVTGAPYAANVVKRGDWARCLAEFWADGPRSETPPGHWNTIANHVADDPGVSKRIGGAGPEVEALEWDVKVYLTVNGAVHDAAIVAWGLKRKYDSVRPISAIRWMGGRGQSSDVSGPAYDPAGLPLEPGVIEVITPATTAPGERHQHLAGHEGEIAVKGWAGEPSDPRAEVAGTRWMRAVEWLPYQRNTFVTPAFPGFVSGHSTFSRSAAEALTRFTGSPYFPGGLGEFRAEKDRFLQNERGPSEDVVMQWATYYDAADDAGLSRLYGGIHIPDDDFNGRRLGAEIGAGAHARAAAFFDGSASPP